MRREGIQNCQVPVTWLWVFLVAMFATGLFFRFANLDRKVYWNDEVWFSLRISGHTRSEMVKEIFDGHEIGAEDLQKYQRVTPEKDVADTIMALAREDPKIPPLYHVLARFWLQIFGDSVEAKRCLSAIISLLVFPCLYWLSRELFGSSLTGWIAVVLMTISPFHVLYAQEAYSYSLWTMTILLSSAALLRALRLQTGSSWAVYAAAVAMGLYTHLLFGLVMIAHGVYVAAVSLETLNLKQLAWPKPLDRYLLATVMGLIAFVPWATVLIAGGFQIHPSWLNENFPLRRILGYWFYNFGSVFLDTEGYPYGMRSPLIDLISLSILALAAYSMYFLCRRTQKRTWFFVLTLTASTFVPLVLGDVIWGGRRSTVARYLIPSYLGLQLALAYLLAARIHSANFAQRMSWRAILAVVIGAGIVSAAISSQAETWWNKAGSNHVPEVARIINKFSRPLVISDRYGLNPGNLMSLSYRLGPKIRLRLVDCPNVPTIPDGFSDILLFNPSECLRLKLEADEKSMIEAIYAHGMLWRLTRK